jgi:peptidoglycan/LPS O-acetylase OafA/YrhL
MAAPKASPQAPAFAGRMEEERSEFLDVSCLKAGEIPGIDGMRAISVLLVMLGHYGFGRLLPGGFGVTAFFFISGFLITALLLREASICGTISIRNFYIRRFLRLQPELFAYVALSALLGLLYLGIPRIADFAAAFLYVTNYYELMAKPEFDLAEVRWPQLWSLAVEEHYYLTFPLLFAALFRSPARFVKAGIIFCAVLLVWRSLLIWSGVPGIYTYIATDCRLDSIAYGCIGALLLWHFHATLSSLRWLRFALPLGIAVLAVSLSVRLLFIQDTVRYSVQGIALLLIFVGLFTPLGRSAAVFLDAPALRWMGRMSYAAYLWHGEWAYAVEHVLGRELHTLGAGAMAILAAAGCAVTFAIAALSHRFIYRRVVALRRRFGSHAAA